MLKRSATYLLCIMTAVAPVSSCSVKEVRDECPLTVRFDTTKVNPAKCTGKVVVDAFKDALEKEEYPTMEDIESGWYFRVKKGSTLVTGVNGIKNAEMQDDEFLVVAPGTCFDPIFANYESFTSYEEEYVITKPLNKQYAVLYVDLKAVGSENVTIRVNGNVAGMNFRTLEPREGIFSCLLQKNDTDKMYSCILPRQKDASLTMDIYFGGTLKDTIDIGRYIAQRYDWAADNLDDIYIEVDYVKIGVNVKVIDWERNIIIDNLDY